MTPATAEAADRARLTEVYAAILARAPEHDLVPSLDRIRAVCELMGDPQRAFAVIHVTGTNGKTSTTRMIDRLLREHGLRTGRFTSPHLADVRERIALDGEPVSVERFLAAYDDVIDYVALVDQRMTEQGEPRLTYFEVLTAMAYAAFADAPVDVAVVEVGMGGTWDATNVADGEVAVITPIAVDHERFLGRDVATIAREKAGIIRSGAPAVIGQQPIEAAEELLAHVTAVGARPLWAGRDFGLLSRDLAIGGQLIAIRGVTGTYADIFLPLFGAHQAHNAAIALAAVESFLGGDRSPLGTPGSAPALAGIPRFEVDADGWPERDAALDADRDVSGGLDPEVVRTAFAAVDSPGRLEVVRRSPTVLVDAAHNPAGAQVLAQAILDSFTFTRLVGVVAVLSDKDATGILAALEPVLDEVVVTRSSSPRSTLPEDLAEIAADLFGEHRVTVAQRLDEAIDVAAGLAEERGEPGTGILVTGSITTVADVRHLLGAR